MRQRPLHWLDVKPMPPLSSQAALPPPDAADLVRSLTDAKRHAGVATARAVSVGRRGQEEGEGVFWFFRRNARRKNAARRDSDPPTPPPHTQDTLKLLTCLLAPSCPTSSAAVRTHGRPLAATAGRALRDADARVRGGAAALLAATAAAASRCGCTDASDAVVRACVTGLRGRGGAEQAAAAHALRAAAPHLPPPPRAIWEELVGLLTDARFVARARLLAAFGTPGGGGEGDGDTPTAPARGLLLAHPPLHPRRAAALLGVAPSRAGPATGLTAASLSVEPAVRRAGARCATALMVAAGASLAPGGACAALAHGLRAVLESAACDLLGAVRDAGVEGLALLDAALCCAADSAAAVVDATPDATAGLVEAVASTSGGGGGEGGGGSGVSAVHAAPLDAASAAGTPTAPPPSRLAGPRCRRRGAPVATSSPTAVAVVAAAVGGGGRGAACTAVVAAAHWGACGGSGGSGVPKTATLARRLVAQTQCSTPLRVRRG